MRMRATKLEEYQFLTCVKHKLWGSRKARFSDWKLGDRLLFLVGNSVGGLAEVAGPAFKSEERVWDNDLFPHRIPLEFRRLFAAPNRPAVVGEIRHALADAYDAEWGLGLVNQWLMKPSYAEKLASLVEGSADDRALILANLSSLLEEARAAQKPQKKKGKISKQTPTTAAEVVPKPQSSILEATPEGEEESAVVSVVDASNHMRGQYALIVLGKIVGCDVWVASNDRNKTHQGKKLGEGCLTELPGSGLSLEAIRAIGLIDVIWFQKHAPIYAFEVEATTSVHSGLLRMADLVEVVPTVKMQLVIVAPKERQAKVMKELQRPTFRRIGLTEFCRFVAIEDVEKLSATYVSAAGHVKPSIIDTVAVALPDELESAMA